MFLMYYLNDNGDRVYTLLVIIFIFIYENYFSNFLYTRTEQFLTALGVHFRPCGV